MNPNFIEEANFPAMYLQYLLSCYTVLCSLHQRMQGACSKPVCCGIHAFINFLYPLVHALRGSSGDYRNYHRVKAG